MIATSIVLYLFSVAVLLSVMSISARSEERLDVMYEAASVSPRPADKHAA